MRDKILIVASKPYDIKNFYVLKKHYTHFDFYLTKNKINIKKVQSINPKWIFFPHYSYMIDKEIYENYTCIIFHMSDLPFARGGSPLQNLIIRGIYQTKISALKAVEKLDAGDIYMKVNFDLSKGNAKKIYQEISSIIFNQMIPFIIIQNPKPYAQKGEICFFPRRKPEQSNLNTLDECNLQKIYDFIRMLDAPKYPKAFLEFKNIKIEFEKVQFGKKQLIGRFKIHEK
ncbi:methionyl-tRNA formyltransferase [Campylobacter sp. MIT 12-5580]|uniref:methionyl-tRNA formyltransferase n=1 Tax=Campylobacter sp. MIT 12-5580 TaxID=2040651 RepID=UPI0010F917A3|nr:methionyl-tRNA formyltransferase [Campylobacter sp. MIT 12-5580]TKX30207.1 methionyl-tRNA formyltransferase [Campylobacter sp. MIT 12-5580]